MKQISSFALGMSLSVVASLSLADASPHAETSSRLSRGHNFSGQSLEETSKFGRPGNQQTVNRTVKVIAYDTMKYDANTWVVRSGETVRFVITNAGKIPHEFVLGDAATQQKHSAMMKRMPSMEQTEPNALTLAPGQTKEIVWQFTSPGKIQAACHIPGHYEAGMVGQLVIAAR